MLKLLRLCSTTWHAEKQSAPIHIAHRVSDNSDWLYTYLTTLACLQIPSYPFTDVHTGHGTILFVQWRYCNTIGRLIRCFNCCGSKTGVCNMYTTRDDTQLLQRLDTVFSSWNNLHTVWFSVRASPWPLAAMPDPLLQSTTENVR